MPATLTLKNTPDAVYERLKAYLPGEFTARAEALRPTAPEWTAISRATDSDAG